MENINISICTILTIGILISCNENTYTSPVKGKIVSSVYASGVIKARKQYEVLSKVNGIIQKVYVKENDIVTTGTPLLKLANENVRLNSANAALAAAFNSIYSNSEKINELKNNILLAQSRYVIDSINYDRQKYLFSRNIGSSNDLEQRKLTFFSSKTALESANYTYDIMLKQLRYLEQQSANSLHMSYEDEKDYTITSKIDGRVYSLLKKEGELINPLMPIAVLGDVHNFYAEVEVDERDIAGIRIHQKAALSLDAYRDRSFDGYVSEIRPIMDEATKTFKVEIDFINRPDTLFPLLTVEANIIVALEDSTLVIPRSYLVNDSFVLTKDGMKRVTVGIKDYEKAEIISGISENDILKKPKR